MVVHSSVGAAVLRLGALAARTTVRSAMVAHNNVQTMPRRACGLRNDTPYRMIASLAMHDALSCLMRART